MASTLMKTKRHKIATAAPVPNGNPANPINTASLTPIPPGVGVMNPTIHPVTAAMPIRAISSCGPKERVTKQEAAAMPIHAGT